MSATLEDISRACAEGHMKASGDVLVSIQLLSFPGCPNADAARSALRGALVAAGLPPTFEEVDITAAETPEELRNWGSPTILVNGTDVAGESPAGASCRLYSNDERRGVPADALILRALSALPSN